MAKRIDRSVENIDDLPDEILCHIISFLPTRYAVCTSILSRRWRNLFYLLSNIDLEMVSIHVDKWEMFWKFLDKRVFDCDIPILRFRLRCHLYFYPQSVAKLLRGLECHALQELDLWTDCKISDGFFFPENLFSRESLEVLKLNVRHETCELQIPDRICLPNLKVLHLKTIGFPDGGLAERLFSSCPSLEELVLNECWFGEGCVEFNVFNQNLKKLTLKFCTTKGKKTVRILIAAPDLIFLSYSLTMEHSLELMDVKSLAEADICFHYDEKGVRLGYITAVPGALDLVQNVKTLKVRYSIIRDLHFSNVPIPLLDMMTCLKIWNWENSFNPICLEYFLSCCVVLETIVFLEPRIWPILPDTENQHSGKKSQLTPWLHHLKTVEFQLLDIMHAEDLMSVIMFFLETASSLEKLKIRSKQGHPEHEVKIMEKIMSLPRVSKLCRFFC